MNKKPWCFSVVRELTRYLDMDTTVPYTIFASESTAKVIAEMSSGFADVKLVLEDETLDPSKAQKIRLIVTEKDFK